jgi:hypothetical protein
MLHAVRLLKPAVVLRLRRLQDDAACVSEFVVAVFLQFYNFSGVRLHGQRPLGAGRTLRE